MPSYVSYLRVSTDKQGITGLGMDAQRESVARYMAGRGEILTEFVEVESGRKDNRPQFAAALEECRRRRAVLLIARRDRLARNVAFIANLMNSDVEFVAVDMPTANRLTIHILAAVAEHEREIISERTKAAMAAAKVRGIKLGNPRCTEALAHARAALNPHPVPRQVVELMLQWRMRGDTLRRIATDLNAMNIRTPRGFRWHASTVRAVLSRHHDVTQQRKDGNTMGRNNETTISSSRLPVSDFAATSSSFSPSGRGLKEEGGDMGSIDEAQKMLDIFASVGANSFFVTKLDLLQQKLWGKSYTAPDLAQKLPFMVRTSLIQNPVKISDDQTISAGENLIVRPSGPNVVFVQLDDLQADQLDRLRNAAFLTIETSPAKYQAWISVERSRPDPEAAKDLVRRVRKAVGQTDKSASGATRICGSRNFKIKYAPEFPTVTITHAVPGRVLMEKELEQMGLVAAAEPTSYAPRFAAASTGRHWPDYARCLQGAPTSNDGSGPNRSMADFTFCLFAARRGFGVEDIAEQLLQVSEKAQERARMRDPGYARITAQNATSAVERERQRSRA